MTQRNGIATGDQEEPKLPRRDWVLLPLIGLTTVCLLAVSIELIARRMFSESKTGFAKCMVLNDPSTGPRGIPNCTCWAKNPESQWVEYKFNSCGHRAGVECGPKQPGVYRIVLVGASIAMGDMVPREKTIAALLPVALSRQTGRKIELYNVGQVWGFSHSTALRFNEALAAQPDMILWLLTAGDVGRALDVLPLRNADPFAGHSYLVKSWLRTKAVFASNSIVAASSDIFGRTRSALLLRHFLFQSQSQYLKSSLMDSGDRGWAMSAAPSPEFQRLLQQFKSDASNIEGRATAAGVPFVAAMVPLRAQAAMISMGEWPQGIDPYKLDGEVRGIILSHGGRYIDTLPDFRNIPNPEQYYFPVDGHPDSGAHAIFANLIVQKLASGPLPARLVGGQTQVTEGTSR